MFQCLQLKKLSQDIDEIQQDIRKKAEEADNG